MRILQVCKKFPYPLNDGERIAIHQLTKGLSEAGAQLTVVALNTNKHYTDTGTIVPPVANVNYHACTIDTTPTFTAFLSSLIHGTSFNIDRFYSQDFERLLIEILSKQVFDIIQLETLYPAIYIPTLRKHTDAKIILRSHNIEHRIWERNSLQASSLFKKKLYAFLASRLRQFELQVLSAIDAIIPISAVDAQWYLSHDSEAKLFTVPTGFDAVPSLTFDFHSHLNLYYLGSMDWLPNKEGITWFINNVWLRLIEIIPTLSLHLPAFNCSESLQKVKGIVWYDYIEDVPSFIASKDVLIVPLFSGSGIRIKIPEAMNYGKPVISTSIGAEGLPFEHNKELLIADTADAFITAIETLHLNRSKLLQIAQAGNAAVRAHFDNYTLSKKLLAYYHRLCTL